MRCLRYHFFTILRHIGVVGVALLRLSPVVSFPAVVTAASIVISSLVPSPTIPISVVSAFSVAAAVSAAISVLIAVWPFVARWLLRSFLSLLPILLLREVVVGEFFDFLLSVGVVALS